MRSSPGPVPAELVGADPFGTVALRTAVLDAWAGSPSRFREDANVEEDLRLHGYADSWFVELAQNAADAARAAGVPGRIRVEVVDGELRVANTGAALDAAGVAALASLRASAKRDDAGSVGRFGVGFTAVLGVTDAPRVVGSGGGVAFSAARTAAAVAALPGAAAELARRDEPPVLRLVWPTAEVPPAGFDTEVRLPPRPGVEVATLLARAHDSAPDLLLALPDLVEITVAGVTLRRVDGPAPDEVTIGERRWRLARRSGTLADADARRQATEQRGRRDWAACWALPLAADGEPEPLSEDVLHAPTATAERLAMPARLIASVPLEPDRRRFRPGPAADRVLAGAAGCYLDLVRATPPESRLALVPAAGFPRSELDGRLRDLLLEALRRAAWLPGAADGVELTPARAEWLDLPGAGHRLFALLAAAGFDRLLAPPRVTTALAELGVHRLSGAELVSRLLGIEQPPRWWRAVYAELEPVAETVPGLLDELRALPVPLADGRMAAGPATVLLPRAVASETPDPGAENGRLAGLDSGAEDGRLAGEAGFDSGAESGRLAGEAGFDSGAENGRLAGFDSGAGKGRLAGEVDAVAAIAALALPGLHVAHPEAAHPLLARLGATVADPAGLLEHPALAAAVERSVDDADAGLDPAPLAAAVLALVTELGGGSASDAVPGLAALALPDENGDPTRADELMLPDAALRPMLAADSPIGVLDPAWARRFPRSALVAVGVLDGFALVVDEDPVAPDHDLDDEDRWWDSLDTPPARLVAVRDLDLVDDGAWPAALALLASERETRAAITAPGSYPAWWLARHARLEGHRPTHYRLPSAAHLATLYDPLPTGTGVRAVWGAENSTNAGLDEPFLAAVGVRADLTVVDVRTAADLLDRLADPRRTPDAVLVAEAHAALATAVATGHVDADDLALPERVRALDGSVVDVDSAVVLDAPWPAAVLPAGELVIGGDPAALAELLDLPLATEVVAADVEGEGRAARWAALPEVVVACHTLGVPVPAGELLVHDELWLTVRRPVTGRRRVPTWVDSRGRWHAEDPVRALLGVLAADEAGA